MFGLPPQLSQVFQPGTTAQGCLQGVFKTSQELDSYEKMWHTHIYQPSWRELKTEVWLPAYEPVTVICDAEMYTI